MIKSLIINPGSTSTKLGIFEDEKLVSEETLRHTTEEIAQFEKIVDQVDFRKGMILDFLAEKGYDPAFGARPVKRAIQTYVENPLAKEILAGKVHKDSAIEVDAAGGSIVLRNKS